MELSTAVWSRLQAAGRTKLRFPVEVYEEAQNVYNRNPTPGPKAMADELARVFPDNSPSETAIRDWIKDGVVTLEAESEPWQLGTPGFTGAEERLVLWALSLPIGFPENVGERRRWRPPKRTARWLVRILQAGNFRLEAERWQDKWMAFSLANMATRGEAREVTAYLAAAGSERALRLAVQEGDIGETLAREVERVYGIDIGAPLTEDEAREEYRQGHLQPHVPETTEDDDGE